MRSGVGAPFMELLRPLRASISHDGDVQIAAESTAHDESQSIEERSGKRSHLTMAKALALSSERSPTPASACEEDYDTLSPDFSAIAEGSRGGKIDMPPAKRTSGSAAPISVQLEQTDRKGIYTLTSSDPEVQDILRNGLKRQQPTTHKHSMFTRRFTTFDRKYSDSGRSPFRGFFTLFWLGVAMELFRIAALNWKKHGNIFGHHEIVDMMLRKDVVVLGLVDAFMGLSTIFGLGLQLLVAKGYIRWSPYGMVIQNLWQCCYLGSIVGFTFYRDWAFPHTVFTVLHAMVLLMKQHSYAFYNGYLSQVLRRKEGLDRLFGELESIDPTGMTFQVSRVSSNTLSEQTTEGLRSRRRKSSGGVNMAVESQDIATIFSTIERGESLTGDQLHNFKTVVKDELDEFRSELEGKSSLNKISYPQNLTVANWFEWLFLPTLVYELEYPRQEKINWMYVLEKAGATFGCLGIMLIISQAYIYPVVAETVRLKEEGVSLVDRLKELPWALLDLLFPILLEQLMSWYLIFESICNLLAELTRFADRGFYGDWWNSVSWDQYARDWNRPVHNFLLRHVYHSSISALHLSKAAATFATFLLSALVHELLMFVMFKKVRGYLLGMQLMQIPLAMMARMKVFKGRDTLGNIAFWIDHFSSRPIRFNTSLISSSKLKDDATDDAYGLAPCKPWTRHCSPSKLKCHSPSRETACSASSVPEELSRERYVPSPIMTTTKIGWKRVVIGKPKLTFSSLLDHYSNPRNVGSMQKNDMDVGTGLVGAPACGDVMKLQIRVDPKDNTISDVKFKTFGCGSAIASSSYLTELVRGMTLEQAARIRNTEIAKELCLPPVKREYTSI
ncbi:hypothetical protein MRB53_038523 [Persea americana]|nr:hypothetical protein MRB53_038523 [Persea americana]